LATRGAPRRPELRGSGLDGATIFVASIPTALATTPRKMQAAATYSVSTLLLVAPTIPTTITPRIGTPVPGLQANRRRLVTPGATGLSGRRDDSASAVTGRRARSTSR